MGANGRAKAPGAGAPVATGRRNAVLWGMGMTLNIPDSVLQGLRIPEGEIAQRLRTELAIALYAQGALSLGKAAELAEMNRLSFGEVVGQRGVARHYGDAELAQDASYARGE
jgi:predicted HTH domain antitoxin